MLNIRHKQDSRDTQIISKTKLAILRKKLNQDEDTKQRKHKLHKYTATNHILQLHCIIKALPII